jgi:hypothetical protein
MKTTILAIAAVLGLAACSGNPFLIDRDTDGNGPPGTEGTPDAVASRPITRTEARVDAAGINYGNGFAEKFAYDAAADTFEVDGLAFDGANVYTRDAAVPDLGPFQAYEGANTFSDSVTGQPIDQFLHRAVQGVSENGNTRFAIVRTGAYIPYGFGGFIYQRNGRVTLPTSGQAGYSGAYAGLRDFNGAGGLEYVEGTMTAAIDFEDFNDSNGLIGDGIQGTVSNRIIRDTDGTDITSSILGAINDDIVANNPNAGLLTELPVLRFKVGPGLISPNGEVAGEASSSYYDGLTIKEYEDGKYYAIISDNGTTNAGEFVGVLVVTGDDPRFESGVTFRETGGFILYRP